ncbi:hypothetical protein PRB91_gp37 [Klebsiella phage BUCT541]|uniref:hypothetical protein n=1 Tax=Klebsiella phage BUCT541 TaxID=2873352 RepID=UPI001E77A81D|nr:hypothetical protein PRB91_gp37 [Klebsiella phage BUCT541]UAW06888.1 hypothetical protein [Klebsiella phage BUCT541]
MIIEGHTKLDECNLIINGGLSDEHDLMLCQFHDTVIIDKHQAAQLIEVLQRWVDDEEIE